MSVDPAAVTRWAADSLLNGSLQGAVAIALIWLASRHFTNVPASVQAALWWLVLVKLVLVLLPIPALPIPLLPAHNRATLADAGLSALDVTTRVRVSAHAGVSGAAHDSRSTTAAHAGSVNRWLLIPIAIWVIGLGLQAVRLLFALRGLRGIVRRSVAAAAGDVALVADLARVLRLSRVPRVRVSAEIDTPQLTGVRRPIVLLPPDDTVTLTANERAVALCHELMHVRRHDLALGWLPALAAQLYFFHPLVRLAAREYVTAREAACDAAVVRALGVSPDEYGRLLIRAGVTDSVPVVAASGASTSIATLRRRLEMLQYVGSSATSRRSMRGLAAITFAAMMPFQLVARTPSDEALGPSAAPFGDVAQPEAVVPVIPASLEEPRDSETTQAAQPRSVEQAVIEEHRAAQALSRRLAAQEKVQRRLHELEEKFAREIAEGQKRQRLVQASREAELQRLQLLQEQARMQRMLAQLEQRMLQERHAAIQRELEAAAHAQSRTYSRGEIVTVAPDADGTRPPNPRVVAVAGDRIQVSRTGIVVNNIPVAGLSPEFLAGLPRDTWETTVPPGHYFVVAEQRSESGESRFWGLIPAERITGPAR